MGVILFLSWQESQQSLEGSVSLWNPPQPRTLPSWASAHHGCGSSLPSVLLKLSLSVCGRRQCLICPDTRALCVLSRISPARSPALRRWKAVQGCLALSWRWLWKVPSKCSQPCGRSGPSSAVSGRNGRQGRPRVSKWLLGPGRAQCWAHEPDLWGMAFLRVLWAVSSGSGPLCLSNSIWCLSRCAQRPSAPWQVVPGAPDCVRTQRWMWLPSLNQLRLPAPPSSLYSGSGQLPNPSHVMAWRMRPHPVITHSSVCRSPGSPQPASRLRGPWGSWWLTQDRRHLPQKATLPLGLPNPCGAGETQRFPTEPRSQRYISRHLPTSWAPQAEGDSRQPAATGQPWVKLGIHKSPDKGYK